MVVCPGLRTTSFHFHLALFLTQLLRFLLLLLLCYRFQHLANLDYILPQEYIEELQILFDQAPTSSYENVTRVVEQELGGRPEDLFDQFDPTPIASASLAQVHVAYDKQTGAKLAIKVQHEGLRETSRGDIFALVKAVEILEYLFPKEFTFGWLADEIAPQLPRELDFINEGNNAERAAACLAQRNHRAAGIVDVVVPKIYWNYTTPRVLCMAFEPGVPATHVQAHIQAGIQPKDVARLISQVFHAQVFLDAFVHCDPHPANVLIRPSPNHPGKPQMVLVDHGLYKTLDDDFRLIYAQLWKALMMADIPRIQEASQKLGVHGKLYTLLSGLLTARPFDEVVERSKTGSLDLEQARAAAKKKKKKRKRANTTTTSITSIHSDQDKAVIRGYAQTFLMDILNMIGTLPRQMLLLLKMNDCLRHIDYALGSPTNTLVVAGRLAAQAVYEHQQQQTTMGFWYRFQTWFEYVTVLWKIRVYEVGATWWLTTKGTS